MGPAGQEKNRTAARLMNGNFRYQERPRSGPLRACWSFSDFHIPLSHGQKMWDFSKPRVLARDSQKGPKAGREIRISLLGRHKNRNLLDAPAGPIQTGAQSKPVMYLTDVMRQSQTWMTPTTLRTWMVLCLEVLVLLPAIP